MSGRRPLKIRPTPKSVAALGFCAALLAMACAEPPEVTLPDPFAAHGTKGVILVSDPDTHMWYSNDFQRAHVAFPPASTFKIPHYLIALEEGAASVDEVFKWDGEERFVQAWNKDQTYKEAFRNSTVPVFQETARRIGLEKMQSWVDEFNYGNKDISGGIDQFWLSGALRISAFQQIDFIRQLEELALPASEENMKALLEVMILEDGEGKLWRGKTGWSIDADPDVGWLVGSYACNERTYFYALNMDLTEPSHRSLRKSIVKDEMEKICTIE